MRLHLESTVTLDGQLRWLSQTSDHSIVCAGGRDPVSGPRSAFNASLRSFSLDNLTTQWEFSLDKSWPFSMIARSGELVFAGIQQNFTRAPCGFWGVDSRGALVTSKVIPTSFLMTGGADGLIVAVPDFEKETMAIAQAYPNDNPLLNVASTETQSVVQITHLPTSGAHQHVIVSYADTGKRRVTYVHALHRPGVLKPIWEFSSANDMLCCDGDSIISYSSEKQKEFEVINATNGQVIERHKFVDNGVQRLQVIEPGLWAVSRAERQLILFSSRAGVLDTVSLATEHPGWLELCVTTDRQRVIALSTANLQGMRTALSVFRVF